MPALRKVAEDGRQVISRQLIHIAWTWLDEYLLLGNTVGHRIEMLVQMLEALVLLRVVPPVVVARDTDLGAALLALGRRDVENTVVFHARPRTLR